jgi:hypothetical protein
VSDGPPVRGIELFQVGPHPSWDEDRLNAHFKRRYRDHIRHEAGTPVTFIHFPARRT